MRAALLGRTSTFLTRSYLIPPKGRYGFGPVICVTLDVEIGDATRAIVFMVDVTRGCKQYENHWVKGLLTSVRKPSFWAPPPGNLAA